MEALGHPPLNSLTSCRRHYQGQQHCTRLLGTTRCLNYSEPSSVKCRPFYGTRHRGLNSIRVQAVEEDDEVRQMKDMAAARKRWEALVREEKVKVLTPREAGYAMQLSNKTLLDVRPSTEHKKAWVKASTRIPIFDVDSRFDAGTLSRKVTNFMMGGWWSGVPTLSVDGQFLSKVEEKFTKDTDLIVACQKGLRLSLMRTSCTEESEDTDGMILQVEILSFLENLATELSYLSCDTKSLAACELLHNAGYRNLFWIQGGLEAADEGDLEREGPVPFKLAGIGGVSEFLGWTDQQRVAAAKEGWGYRLVFSARLVGVFLVADALLFGAQQAARYLQEIRSH
ncbi:hypothetical protein RHGRI_034981 [Rhododendron griersonianum]|uniref:Rhodanese domain-containing protein n=1 Tax=Rhododendron griersonianum TaxID=479676 RepID=A0AAV6I6R1_9ERIC|nr:hypothetical protein RHGRI_034981 [Rhododendron griersonianum]